LLVVIKFDKIFIHREIMPLGPPLFEWIISRILKKDIIYDFDDAIWIENTTSENKLARSLKWHSKTENICKWSKTVSIGNHFLGEYAGKFNDKININPTTIDTQNLHIPIDRNNSIPIIGWTGTHSTGKYLSQIMDVLQELALQFEFRFLYISNKEPDVEIPNLKFIKWSKESEIAELNRIDIGIMPL
jgi:hypothetical protein